MDLKPLERAAETILSPLASQEDRQNAEAILNELKSVDLGTLNQILESSSNHFVLFMVAQALGEVVLKQWVLLDQEQISGLYHRVLNYVAVTEELPQWVTAAFTRSVAMILKRATFDNKAGSIDDLFDTLQTLLMNANSPRLPSIGCQLISAIAEQYCTSWRNSKFAITWDFHTQAKTAFEVKGWGVRYEIAIRNRAENRSKFTTQVAKTDTISLLPKDQSTEG